MDVASIMSMEPTCVTLDTPVESARNLMDSEDIRHLPIVSDGRIVGLVSDRDLYPTESELLAAADGAGESGRTIADVLQDRLAAVAPDDSLVTAASQCLAQEDGCLPVMRGAQLVGILSEMDLLRTFTRSWQKGSEAGQPQVDELMTPFPLEATPETTVIEAIGMCHSLRAHHLPVVDGDTLAGIVSDRDLRRCASAGRATDTTLAEIMEREPFTIGPDHPATEAAVLMATAKVSALPVVEGEQLVGILTLTDLIHHFMDTLCAPQGHEAR